MNSILELLSSASVTLSLGWTLVHFVWQAALISLIACAVQHAMRPNSSHARYLVLCGGLALMIISPIITFAVLLSANESGLSSASNNPLAINSAESENGNRHLDFVDETSSLAVSPPSSLNPLEATNKQAAVEYRRSWAWTGAVSSRAKVFLPWCVAFWIAGVLILAIRLLFGFNRVKHWRLEAMQIADSKLLATFSQLQRAMSVRPVVHLLQSTHVMVPMVIGWLKPVVMIPASLISNLTTQEIESILAHELAHIRRHDYLINLVQIVAETALFYHPAVWWISSKIRVERENCCDDIAISVCGDRLVFATALSRIEELRLSPQRLIVAADGGSLIARIRRLTLREPGLASRWPAGIFTLMAIPIAVGGLWMANETASHLHAANDPLPNPIPVELAKSPLDEYQTHKSEIKKIDSKTGIEKRVYDGIKLTSNQVEPAKSAQLEMMYSNVMMYTFVPERIVKQLGAVQLGEIDFGETAPPAERQFQTGIDWSASPDRDEPADNQPKEKTINVDQLKQPGGEVQIVPYKGDAIWIPGHLGFYGMNQTKQHKFKVVKIDSIDLGVGLPLGPLNVLVLNDANSDFGVLGRNVVARVRGKKGESLWWYADGTFQLVATQKKAQRLIEDDADSDSPSVAEPTVVRPPIRRPDQLRMTSNQPESKIDLNLVRPEIKRIKTRSYSMASRASTGWVLVDGVRKPIDGGVEYDGVIVYVTLMSEVVAVDAKTNEVKWRIPWGKTKPIWQAVSVVELELEDQKQIAIELFATRNKTRELIFRYVDLKTGEPIDSPIQSESVPKIDHQDPSKASPQTDSGPGATEFDKP